VHELIQRLGQQTGLVGADVMEVAPGLARPGNEGATVALAAAYVRQTLGAMLARTPPVYESPRDHDGITS
jgi:arginase family enzyme